MGSERCQGCIVEQVNQSFNVVTAEHHAEQFNREGFVNQGRAGFVFQNGAEKSGFNVGCFIDTGRNAVGDQVEQGFCFICWWIFQ